MKETKELLKGLLDVVKVSAELFKDGVQVQDLIDGYTKLNGDPVKKAELEAALANVSAVPAELKAISLADGLELVILLVQELPGLLEAFKPKAA